METETKDKLTSLDCTITNKAVQIKLMKNDRYEICMKNTMNKPYNLLRMGTQFHQV